MEFSLGFLKSEEKVSIKSFSGTEQKEGQERLIDLFALKDENLQGLFLPNNLYNGQTLGALGDEDLKFPIRKAEDFNLNQDSFEAIDSQTAYQYLLKIQSNWSLQNNLTLIDELFSVVSHLKNLYKNQRTTFFEELWFILKTNLGTQKLTIIYNDLIPQSETSRKNKLIVAKIIGEKYPEPVPGEEIDVILLDNHKNDFLNHFQIMEFNKEKSELVVTASVDQSPILIMANLFSLSPLQKVLMNSLFQGLQKETAPSNKYH